MFWSHRRGLAPYLLGSVILALVLWLRSARAGAAPVSIAEEFAAGKSNFQYGNYKEAIRILRSLLYPTPQISDEGQLIEAYRLLGVSYFFEGNRPAAQREFASLL